VSRDRANPTRHQLIEVLQMRLFSLFRSETAGLILAGFVISALGYVVLEPATARAASQTTEAQSTSR